MLDHEAVVLKNAPDFLTGGGETGALMRAHDWAATPLGTPEGWPQALKTLVAVMLGSNQPMFIAWGPQGTLLYNDAYAEILGNKHPATGQPFLDVWHEIRADLAPIVERAYAGQPVQMDDIRLVMHRKGYPEETHFAFSYTPVRDEAGKVAGFFCPCVETTAQVLADRRRNFLIELEQRLRGLSDPLAITAAAQEALGRHLKASRVGYGEVDAGERYFTTAGNWTDGTVPSRHGTHDLAGFGPEIWAALRGGEKLVVRDVFGDPRTNSPEGLAAFAAIDTAAVLTASLVKDGRMRAALYVHHREPQHWTDDDAALVEEVAERTWAAVERARAEQQLRIERDRSRGVLEGMGEGFMLIDRDFRVLDINPEGIRHDTRPREEIVGRVFWEVWPGIEQSELGPIYKRAMAERTAGSIEHRYVALDGHEAWFDTRVYPTDEGLALFYRDVTGRKQDAEALRASEERLRIAQATGGVGAFELLPGTGRIMVSEQFCRLWGVPFVPETQVEVFLNLIHPEDRERVQTGSSELPEQALGYVEYRIIRPDTGEIRWMARQGEAVHDSASGRTRYFGVSYDITGRKTAEAALRDANETLETLNRVGAAVAAELDLERVVQIVTDAGVELTGARFGAFFYNVLNEAGESFMLYTLSGAERSDFESFGMPRATAVFRPTFVGEGVIRSDDILKDPRYGLSAPHHGMPKGHLPVRSYLAVPVTLRSGEVVGGLFFGHPEPGRFLERHERQMVGIAAQAAIAIDNARLFQSAQREIEERRRAEAAARHRAEELEAVLDATPAAILIARDPSCLEIYGNRHATELMRMPPHTNISRSNGAAPARHFTVYGADGREVPPDRLPVQRAARGEELLRHEERVQFEDGTSVHLLGNAVPLRDESGAIRGAVGAFIDISERKRAEEHQRLLIDELNHRVKNSLAIVQGVAQQTFKDGAATPEARAAFEGRLAALSAAHNLLTRQNWEAASIRQIIGDAVAAVGPRSDKVHIDGPDLLLQPKTAVSLAMAVHELATNAVKYGSLSDAEGGIDVGWRTEAGRLKLEWREHGGPAVTPPARRGFGTRMIERGLAAELGGRVTIDFAAKGLVCTVDAPLPGAAGLGS